MKQIENKSDFFEAELYYPQDPNSEKVWYEVYKVIKSSDDDPKNIVLTVKEMASHLLKNKDLLKDTPLLQRIWNLYEVFDFNKYSVEASKGRENKIFLRGGNKRSIAFAMRILNNIDNFKPIIISDWKSYHYRWDTDNDRGGITTLEEII